MVIQWNLYSDLMGFYSDFMGSNGDLMGFNGDLLGIYGALMGFTGDPMEFFPLGMTVAVCKLENMAIDLIRGCRQL